MPDGLVQDLFHQINLNPTKEQSKSSDEGGSWKDQQVRLKLIEIGRLAQAIINVFKFLERFRHFPDIHKLDQMLPNALELDSRLIFN